MEASAIGLAWYSPEGYSAARARMVDAHKLPATYERWLALALKGEQHSAASGLPVIRVPVDGDDFLQFCRGRGLALDSHARRTFASYVAAKMVQSQTEGSA